MKISPLALWAIGLLVSSQVIGQTTPSTHPKLDALFHHNQKPASTPQPATTTEPAPSPAASSLPPQTTQASRTDSTVQSPVANTPRTQSINGNQASPSLSSGNQIQNTAPATTAPQQATSQIQNVPTSSSMYRDTRLGSSSPLYNTYQKNDYGAGAITTNPNK
ncbi:MAG: hypothetical protein KGM98_10475 [Bacteroidota bacterium]|nr:hypothetical protein [Bacteroidota bacterium]